MQDLNLEGTVKPFLPSTTTIVDDRVFDFAVLKNNGIHPTVQTRNPKKIDEQINNLAPNGGTFKTLLKELMEANTANVVLTEEEKALLDYRQGDCDYILSNEFQQTIKGIPDDDEGEWIAYCHNLLSHLFRTFTDWQAKSVVAVIDEGLKPDRIFGFEFATSTASPQFSKWYKTDISWPFLLIESKPATNLEELADIWKMAIIEAFGCEQQIRMLTELKVPIDNTYLVNVHMPLTFGIYYVGSIVHISVYTLLNGKKHFIRFRELELQNNAANVLKMFLIIKRYCNEMHESVLIAYDDELWNQVETDTKKQESSSIPPKNAKDVGKEASIDDKGNMDNKDEPEESEHEPSANLVLKKKYINAKHSSVELVYDEDKRRAYIVKNTLLKLAKREYAALQHLQGLSMVPHLMSELSVESNGKRAEFALSWLSGVHPRSLNSRSELRTFLKALLMSVHEVHKRGIVHNDIKEENIIWNSETGSAFLIDFGCATEILGSVRAHTPGYCSHDELRTPVSDIYSIGVVLINIIFGINIRSALQLRELRRCSDIGQALKWVTRNPNLSFTEPTLSDEKSFDLARQMTAPDPSNRITVARALMHGYFDAIEDCGSSQPREKSYTRDI